MSAPIDTDVRLVLLIHHREWKKPTNTGMIAVRSLTNSECHVVGRLDNPLNYSDVILEDVMHLMLFPSPHAEVLTPEHCKSYARPLRLIVPDGNWGQATRMGRRLLQHANIPCVTLPDTGPGQFILRREAEDRPQGLATCEAIARAYALLEHAGAARHIMSEFETFYNQIRSGQRRGL